MNYCVYCYSPIVRSRPNIPVVALQRTDMSELVFWDHFYFRCRSTFLFHFSVRAYDWKSLITSKGHQLELSVHLDGFSIQKSYKIMVIVHSPRSRVAYTNFCMENRRHFGFPIDTNQVPYTKVVWKPSLSYSPTLTYSLYKLLYWNRSPFWIRYRYQSSSLYKSRTETKFVVQPHAHVQPIQTFV